MDGGDRNRVFAGVRFVVKRCGVTPDVDVRYTIDRSTAQGVAPTHYCAFQMGFSGKGEQTGFMTPPIITGTVFGCTLAYAIVRYNLCGDVPWSNVPVYVVNKSTSWTGLILFGLSLLSRKTELRRYYGTRAVVATVAHVVMSILVLDPPYFSKFFGVDGRMNAIGESSMLAGVAGFLVLMGLFFVNQQGKPGGSGSLRTGWGRLVLWCSGAHVAIMGVAGWLRPETWPGYLPPITLLSFVTVGIVLVSRRRRSH